MPFARIFEASPVARQAANNNAGCQRWAHTSEYAKAMMMAIEQAASLQQAAFAITFISDIS